MAMKYAEGVVYRGEKTMDGVKSEDEVNGRAQDSEQCLIGSEHEYMPVKLAYITTWLLCFISPLLTTY